eukprot:scaffold26177_cov58-Phaeocystis_antarctica.AAC.2
MLRGSGTVRGVQACGLWRVRHDAGAGGPRAVPDVQSAAATALDAPLATESSSRLPLLRRYL